VPAGGTGRNLLSKTSGTGSESSESRSECGAKLLVHGTSGPGRESAMCKANDERVSLL
jgi:hypothetical protein